MKKITNLFISAAVLTGAFVAIGVFADGQTGGVASINCTNDLAMADCCAPTNTLASLNCTNDLAAFTCCQPTNTFASN